MIENYFFPFSASLPLPVAPSKAHPLDYYGKWSLQHFFCTSSLSVCKDPFKIGSVPFCSACRQTYSWPVLDIIALVLEGFRNH